MDDPNKFHFLLNKKLPYKTKAKNIVEEYELSMDRNEESELFDEETNALFDDNIDEEEKYDEDNDGDNDNDNNSSTKESSDSSSDSESDSDSSSDSESHE